MKNFFLMSLLLSVCEESVKNNDLFYSYEFILQLWAKTDQISIVLFVPLLNFFLIQTFCFLVY